MRTRGPGQVGRPLRKDLGTDGSPRSTRRTTARRRGLTSTSVSTLSPPHLSCSELDLKRSQISLGPVQTFLLKELEANTSSREVRNILGAGKNFPLTAQVKGCSPVGQRKLSKQLMNEAKNEHRCRQWLSIKQDLSELLAHYGVVLCLPPGLQVNQFMEASSKWLLLPCAWTPIA